MHNSYRQDIQALRGLALICVVINHISKAALPNGFLGVDIFFVLSGFSVLSCSYCASIAYVLETSSFMAEDEGFEPSVGCPTHAFQACALGRYANPPVLLTRLKGIGGDD